MSKPTKILEIEQKLGVTLKQGSSWQEHTYQLSSTGEIIELNLEESKLTDISFVSSFTSLVKLNLWNNKIEDASPLKTLQQLKDLDIGFNPINSYSFLIHLSNLERLVVSHNKISNIDFIKHLPNLTKLFLSYNNIVDITPLKYLGRLSYLSIEHNKIVDIEALSELTTLRTLHMAGNNISDISPLRDLTALTNLDLSGNKIIDISVFEKLKKLDKLDLSHNKIFDISPLFELLYRKKNPMELKMYFSSADKYIRLDNNPTTSPPYNLLQQGKQATIDWLIANKKALHEIKVLLVGQPESGKTSLLKRLKYDTFSKNEKQTDGILIEKFNFQYLPAFEKYPQLTDTIAHFWDFGGQEIMNATHQFFMTKRSVYILLLESRNDNETNNQVREWLKRIATFGGNSPIMVLVNKIEVNRGFGLDTTALTREFPQIKRFINISCKKGEGIEEVKNALAELIPQTELFNTFIDERWIEIKEELQNATEAKHYLPDTQFRNICKEKKLIEKYQQNDAIRFLHDLGILLHFEELNLEEYYVLDPQWVTSGVYEVITSPTVAQEGGKIYTTKLNFVINEEEGKKGAHYPKEYKRIVYSPNEVRYIADIMTQFKLAYYDKNKQYLFVPSLFPMVTPEYSSNEFLNAKDGLQLVYEYDFLPANILPRFMVEMQHDIHEYWRSGVILHCRNRSETTAMVIAEERRIKIIIRGIHKEKREYLSVIRYQLDILNSGLNIKKPTLLIPLPNTENKYVKYILLRNMEREGEKYYVHYEEDNIPKYELAQLLEGIAEDVSDVGANYKHNRDKGGNRKLNSVMEYFQQYNLSKVFDLLDEMGINDFSYNRLKQEYIQDKTDVDFMGRLETYIKSR